jgi:hypothetical protein
MIIARVWHENIIAYGRESAGHIWLLVDRNHDDSASGSFPLEIFHGDSRLGTLPKEGAKL